MVLKQQKLSNGVKKLYLFNTLSREKEEFKPIRKGEIGLYTCGPTVYNYAHIGNLRAYLFEDILKRTLLYNGYKVKHVMNITDVGHLTGDRDMGEDKVEMEAKKKHKTAWEIAEFYAKAFKEDLKKLNILEPDIWCKATENIPEQIDLIKKLEEKGYTYKTSDGIYFDTSKFKGYTKLSHQKLESLREGARVEKNPEKKNPTDFALWKFSPSVSLKSPSYKGDVRGFINPPTPPLYKGGIISKRQMEWESPWGIGFPGWHIECSAMSMKFLSRELDIHCGGVDHINVHHTNEIAQSEAATGKKFFNFWLHGAFLNITGGKKMAKSEENFFRLRNIEEYTFNVGERKVMGEAIALRYLFLKTHYRKNLEFSWQSLEDARISLGKIRDKVKGYKEAGKKGSVINNYKDRFIESINNDLNTPQALSVLWDVIRADGINRSDKLATILDFDKVLGLNLDKIKALVSSASTSSSTSTTTMLLLEDDLESKIKSLIIKREKAREEKNFKESDRLREEIEKLGYTVEDAKEGMRVFRK